MEEYQIMNWPVVCRNRWCLIEATYDDGTADLMAVQSGETFNAPENEIMLPLREKENDGISYCS